MIAERDRSCGEVLQLHTRAFLSRYHPVIKKEIKEDIKLYVKKKLIRFLKVRRTVEALMALIISGMKPLLTVAS